MRGNWIAFSFVLSLMAGCVSTGAEDISIPMSVSGSAVMNMQSQDGYGIELMSAELAFGPLYLCPSDLSGAGCGTARAENQQSVVVDLLDPTMQDAGVLKGQEGFVGSFWYDLGRTVLLSEDLLLSSAAESLNGKSVRLLGVATKDQQRVPFEIALPLDLLGGEGGTLSSGVALVRGRSESVVTTLSSTTTLELRFDPSQLFAAVSLGPLLRGAPTCDIEGMRCVEGMLTECVGGMSISEQSCPADAPLCLSDTCQAQISIDSADDYPNISRAVTQAVLAMRPIFMWNES